MIQVLISITESAYKEMCENGIDNVDYYMPIHGLTCDVIYKIIDKYSSERNDKS